MQEEKGEERIVSEVKTDVEPGLACCDKFFDCPPQVIGLQVRNHLGLISCHRFFRLCTARRAYSRIESILIVLRYSVYCSMDS